LTGLENPLLWVTIKFGGKIEVDSTLVLFFKSSQDKTSQDKTSQDKMGFDLYIGVQLKTDAETGRPYILGPDQTRIPYDTDDYKVPEEFRSLVWQRGLQFHVYVSKYADLDLYQAPAADFLQNYPDWAEVSQALVGFPCDDWTERKHDSFKTALQWFASRPGYYLFWSY